MVSVTVRSVRPLSPFSMESLLEGLPRPQTLAWVPPAVDSSDARAVIAEEVPVDGSEVVEWMHYAAADNAVLDVFAQSVEDNGGQIGFRSGDGNIPGVRESRSFYAVSEPGYRVRSRGYAVVVTPHGRVSIPVGGKRTIVYRDFLGWAAVPAAYYVQYIISLLRWVRLPRAPIRRKMPFPSSHGRVAPNFIVVSTRVPAPTAILRMVLTSSKKQRMLVRGRSTGDYTRVYFEKTIDVEEGEAEYVLAVTAFPAVPAMVLELQPEDGARTTLNSLDVFP